MANTEHIAATATLLTGFMVVGCGRLGFDETDLHAPSIDSDAMPSMIPPACPPRYSARGSSCYQFIEDELSWLAAEGHCGRQLGHLAVIEDAAGANIVAELLSGPREAWIGTTDRVTESRYLTIFGSTPFLSLGDAQSDDARDCLRINRAVGMRVVECDRVAAFVCQFTGRAADSSAF